MTRHWTLVCVTLAALTVSAAPRQRPTFRSTANGVLVNVFVTAGGKPVDGLTSDDLALFDDGAPQKIEIAPATAPIDLTLVLDASVRSTRYVGQLRRVTRELTASLRRADRTRLLASADVVTERSPFRSASEPLPFDHIGDPDGQRSAYMLDALLDAFVQQGNPEHRQVVVAFLTAGAHSHTFSGDAFLPIASATDAVAYIAALPPGGLLPPTWYRAIGQLASATGGELLLGTDPNGEGPDSRSFQFSDRLGPVDLGGAVVVSFREATDAIRLIVNDVRHGYVLSYVTPGGPNPGWHDISVRVVKPGLQKAVVRARKRYFVPSTPRWPRRPNR